MYRWGEQYIRGTACVGDLCCCFCLYVAQFNFQNILKKIETVNNKIKSKPLCDLLSTTSHQKKK